MRKKDWENVEFSTIYFGGGTPSILNPSEIYDLLSALRKSFRINEKVEISLELNPENGTSEYLKSIKEIGITRLSIGIQSFDNSQLQWMNRVHSSIDAIECISNAKKVRFDELSLDIIYGLPNSTIASLEIDLSQLIAHSPEHISAYCLTVEEKTALNKLVRDGKIEVSNNEEQAMQFDFLVDFLKNAGYEQYEISNFARNKHYAKHNTAYWQGESYLGLGPSAHGFKDSKRYWNIANNSQYIKQLSANILPEEFEILSSKERFNELLLTGLRTKWGVSLRNLNDLVPLDRMWEVALSSLIKNGEIIQDKEMIYLTQKGRLRADAISSDLFL